MYKEEKFGHLMKEEKKNEISHNVNGERSKKNESETEM